jgi:hypothetical protein
MQEKILDSEVTVSDESSLASEVFEELEKEDKTLLEILETHVHTK